MPNIGPLELLILFLMIGVPLIIILRTTRGRDKTPCWHCGERTKLGTLKCANCGAEYPARPPA